MPLNARCETTLGTVSPKLAALVRNAAASLETQGTYICVVSGLRTADEQNALYAQGRTTPGHIITNARAGASMHNYGLAVDVVPYLTGQSGNVNWSFNTPQFKAMVAAFTSLGLVWGGSWKTLADYDHFQMPGLPNSPTKMMQADYQQGNGNSACLTNIWTCCDQGKYAV